MLHVARGLQTRAVMQTVDIGLLRAPHASTHGIQRQENTSIMFDPQRLRVSTEHDCMTDGHTVRQGLVCTCNPNHVAVRVEVVANARGPRIFITKLRRP